MIKFFRHIRRSLINENNMGKPALPDSPSGRLGRYFKYAIGEILLVVIGILIALQINNWNKDRKDRAKEQELLAQLQSEFQSNLEQLEQKIAIRNTMQSSSLKLLDYVDHLKVRVTDSIFKHLGLTILAPTFDPIVNDAISSGRVQLLQSSELKERLSRWTSEIVQVTEEEQVWLNYRNNYYTPTLLNSGLYRNLVNRYWEQDVLASFHLDLGTKTELEIKPSKKEINVPEMLDNPEFENHFVQCATFAKLTNSQALSLRQRIVEILELIEQNLDN